MLLKLYCIFHLQPKTAPLHSKPLRQAKRLDTIQSALAVSLTASIALKGCPDFPHNAASHKMAKQH